MHNARKTAFPFALLIAGTLAVKPCAHAQSVQLFSPFPGATTLTFPFPYTNTSYAATAGGVTLTFTTPGMYVFTDNRDFVNQIDGTAFVFYDYFNGQGQIDFSQGVNAVGFTAKLDLTGGGGLVPEHFIFTAFDGATALGTYTVTADNNQGPGAFLGVQAINGNTITRLNITGYNNESGPLNGNPPGPFPFVIGPVAFLAPVPEPGSIALLASAGTIGAAFLRRRKQAGKAV